MENRAHFRPDIQGMRALAVLAVIFYHLPGEILVGGYLGVDVFFVISGYLITNQIVGKINEKTFSLFEFYKNRFWRLFPAMIFVVLITLIYASWVMSIGDLKKASHSALSATFSLSNFYFFSQEGYFDTAARVKPFLHTWSLAVEEQFYLFWPVGFRLLGHAFNSFQKTPLSIRPKSSLKLQPLACSCGQSPC